MVCISVCSNKFRDNCFTKIKSTKIQNLHHNFSRYVSLFTIAMLPLYENLLNS